jgi:hypothetical protein
MSAWSSELCADVRPTALDWLWPRYLLRGKLIALDGDPEMGKSLVTPPLASVGRSVAAEERRQPIGQPSET